RTTHIETQHSLIFMVVLALFRAEHHCYSALVFIKLMFGFIATTRVFDDASGSCKTLLYA
ncbi:MAG: hypothetical protein ACRCWP_01130, partial [Shewanella sp.]